MDYIAQLACELGELEVTANTEENTVMVEDVATEDVIILRGDTEVDQLIECLKEAKYELR